MVHRVVYRIKVRHHEPVSQRSGYKLPLLLLGAFKSIIDELHDELARCGHEEARPVHGFALQAIGIEGTTVGELGRRLGVSKQAAAKTAKSLEEAGYIARAAHTPDGRAWTLSRTERGAEMLELSAEILDRLRQRWDEHLGKDRMRDLEDDLAALSKDGPAASINNIPGWFR
jgi:DNA-binding MarR family transcriptional regulator